MRGNRQQRTGDRILAWLTLLLVLTIVGRMSGEAYADDAPQRIETRTETQRSLMGGFWRKNVITTTTADRVTLDDVATGSLLISTDETGEYIEAPRLDTKVTIDVTGIIARVVVTQSFANPAPEWAEGIYAFPLPEDAAVDSLRMRVGETVIEGEIMEKEVARQTYARAKRDGTRASLVEQSRPNLFKTAVANIAPRDTVHVEISYLETLRYDSGKFSLRFPLTITPRYSPSQLSAGMLPSANPVGPPDVHIEPAAFTSIEPPPASLAEIRVRLNSGFPLRALTSRSHEVNIHKNGLVHDLALRDLAVPMDRDFVLEWEPATGAEPGAAVFTEELAGETYALLMFLPPQSNASQARIARETIIVLDTSGSMAGASFRQAREAVGFALDLLSEGDYFNIIEFNSDMSSLYQHAQAATATSLENARRFLSRLDANGGTNMAPALSAALDPSSGSGLLRQVVFITDGAVDNERELFGLIERELGDSRLFTVGIGSAPNSFFMRKAAETGRGTYSYVSATQHVRERIVALFEKLEAPVLKDIAVRWPDADTDAWPARTPDLYQKEPLVVSAKLSSLPKIIAIEGSQAGRSWRRELPLARGEAFDGVATLWARNKIGSLMDGLSQGHPLASVRAAVVPLALKHKLVTRFTSLVAVDTNPVRPLQAALRKQQIQNATPAGSSVPYPVGATPAFLQLILGGLLLVFATVMRLVEAFE